MLPNNIILVSHNQFGYQTDFYKYAQYLKELTHVSYVCLDTGKEKVMLDDVDVKYIPSEKNKLALLFSLIKSTFIHIKKEKPEMVIVKYFPFCFLIQLASFQTKFVLDIRSATVTSNKLVNYISDALLYFTYVCFKYSIVLSESLKTKFHLKKAFVIPLGADIIESSDKKIEALNLLYVGTLNNRDIDKTIEGVKIFKEENPTIKLQYKIVGMGSKQIEERIKHLILNYKLSDSVFFLGSLKYTELVLPYKISNVGVSFIPMTPYFDKQPPTKTFEYLMSGMPVLATKTFENQKYVTESCGVLIEDNPRSFAFGLKKLFDKRHTYSSLNISNLYSNFTWERIVNKKLSPLLQMIHND